MKNCFHKILILFGGLLFLASTAAAGGPWIPVKSVVNQVYGTLYVVNNGELNSKTGAAIECYTYSPGSWTKAAGKSIKLPDDSTSDPNSFGAKCYGLAVSADGTRLFVPVSKKSGSRLRIYDLSNGLPVDPNSFTAATWGADEYSIPMGIAASPRGTKVYLADPGNSTLRVFDYDENYASWVYKSDQSRRDPSFTSNNIFDVSVASPYGSYVESVFLSEKLPSGQIFRWVYYFSGNAQGYPYPVSPSISNLSLPTQIKFSPDKYVPNNLFSSLGGADGKDIYVYLSEYPTWATFSSGIKGAYGWTALDAACGFVLFKKALDSGESDNALYKAAVSSITMGGEDYPAAQIAAGLIASDGLSIAIDRKAIVLSNSRYGSIQVLDNSSGQIFTPNQPPQTVNDPPHFTKQGSLRDIDVALPQNNYSVNYNYATNEGKYDPENRDPAHPYTTKISLSFLAKDSDYDRFQKVRVIYKRPAEPETVTTWKDGIICEKSDFQVEGSGGNLLVTIPCFPPPDSIDNTQTGLPPGEWEWGVSVFDGYAWSQNLYYNKGVPSFTNQAVADFEIDTEIPRATAFNPADQSKNVPINKPVKIDFSEPIKTSAFDFECIDEDETKYITLSPTWSNDNKTVTLDHATGFTFAANKKYTFTIKSAQDAAGNDLNLWAAAAPEYVRTTFTTSGTPIDPTLPDDLEQYNYNGDKKLSALSPPNYVNKAYYTENGTTRIKIKFSAQNVSGIKMVRVYKNPSSENVSTPYYAGDFSIDTDQNTVTLNFQKESENSFGDQKIKWGVQISYYDDGSNLIPESGPALYNEDPNSTVDYTIDRISPSITSFDPADGEEKVGLTKPITINFKEADITREGFAFTCVDGAGTPYLSLTKKAWSDDNKSVTLSHEGGQFLPDTSYTFTVTKAYDEAGNPLTGTLIKATFKTAPQVKVTRIYPNSAPNNTKTQIVVLGEGFAKDITTIKLTGENVEFAAQEVLFVSSTKLLAVVPLGITPGEYHTRAVVDTVVSDPTDADIFTVTAPGDDIFSPIIIKDFSASDDEDRASYLKWTNPPDGDLDEVAILKSETGWPRINTSGQPISPAVEIYRNSTAEPGAIENYFDQNLVNGKTYSYAAYSRDTSGNWNTILDYTQPDVNADSAVPNQLDPPEMESIEPADVYLGQTITINGYNLGRGNSSTTLTVGGKTAKPTYWAMNKIVLAVPSLEGTGSKAVTITNNSGFSHTLYIRIKSGGIVLDDFEGGCVSTNQNITARYYSYGAITPDNSRINTEGKTTSASHEGVFGMQVKYAGVSAGSWQGYMANTYNLSGMDSFKLYLKGDGTNNTARLHLKSLAPSSNGLDYNLISKEFSLSNASWKMVILKMSDFHAQDVDGNSLDMRPEYWNQIYTYYLVYSGTNANSNIYQSIDFVQAYNSKLVAPTIVNARPNPAYLGQTITITGALFLDEYKREVSDITIGGIKAYPTSWANGKIVTAAPRTLKEGMADVIITNANGFTSDPCPLSVSAQKMVLDDFEGGDVGSGQFDYDGNGKLDDSSYFIADKYPPKATTSYPDQQSATKYAVEGKLSREIWYSYGSRAEDANYTGGEFDWGGGWGGKFVVPVDFSGANVVKFYVRWDGSLNDMTLTFKDKDGTVTGFKIPNATLMLRCNQQFGSLAIPRSFFAIDYNYGGDDYEFDWDNVISYTFIYNTKFGSAPKNYHYVDELQVLWDNIAVVSAGIAREEDVNLSVSVSWETSPQYKPVDIYTTEEAFTTDASKWKLEFTNVMNTKQVDQGEVGSGKAKYYKVVPAGSVFSNDLLTSEVLGKFDWEVVEGNNFVSIPLIPSGSTMADIIGNQINPAQDKESADVIYYYNASNNQWMDAWRRIESNYLVWNGDMSSMEADRGYFVTIKPGSKAKNISVVGKVFLGDSRSIDLYKFSNMVGSVFPFNVDLNNSGLASVLTASTLPVEADKIYYYDAKIQKWQVAYLDSSGKFLSQKLNYLEPGKGYYINNQDAANPETWDYTRP